VGSVPGAEAEPNGSGWSNPAEGRRVHPSEARLSKLSSHKPLPLAHLSDLERGPTRSNGAVGVADMRRGL